MKLARKLLAIALSFGLLAQGPAEAATFYYYRGAGGSGSGQPTGTPPASPAAPGVFAILVDAPVPNVAFLGDAYNATTYAYSNVGQVVYSLKSGSLPPGISFSPATGTIAGSATSMGSFSAVVQGLDSATGKTATASVQIDSVTTPSISGTPSAYAAVGLPYSATFTFAGGTQPYTFSIASLPPGLTLSPSATTATLAGTPTVAGTYPVAVVGTEAHGLGVQYPYSLTVAGPVSISGMPPATGTIGIPYSGQLVVSGGAAPYTFSLAAGTLPLGVTLKPGTGVISGTPTTAGTKSGIKIKVTDAAGQSATSAPFAIAISSTGPQTLTISGTPPATGVEGTAYASQFTAGGGSGSGYVYSLTGTLPSGLSLNAATGLLSGTPSAGTAGSYPGLVVHVTDNASNTAATSSFTLSIGTAPVPLAIAGNPPSSTQQGDAYVAKFTGTGGSGGGYVYTLAGAALPPGLSLNSATGLISGAATTVGTYSGIVIQVKDSSAHTAVSAPFAIAVGAPAPLAISGSPAPSINQNAAYLATWTAFDGSGSGYHFTSVGAALPPGLSIADVNGVQGQISGTATVAGTYSGLRVQVQDSAGNTALSPLFSIQVVPTALPNAPLSVAGSAGPADLDVAYSAQFVANGGAGGYVYSLGAGALPPGLSLDPVTGLVSGTPSAVGTYAGIVVSVADTASATASTAPFSIVVTDPNPLTIAFNPQTNWQVGDFVAESAAATGGDSSSYSYSAIGALPSGLSLAGGTLFGSLDAAGTFGPFRIQVTDGVRTATTGPVTFTVAAPGLFVSGFPSGSAVVGDAYSAQFSAQGGSGAGYTFSMIGTLPAGLSLDPVSGLISGTPTATGTSSGLAVQVTDSSSTSAVSASFSIAVSAAIPPLAIAGSPSGSATLAQAYSAQFSASGGSGTGYVYTMVGTLPAGLSLNSSNGLISGSPTAVGTYSGLRVKVTDSSSASATSTAFSIVVSAPAATLTLAGFQNPSATVGTPYTAQFTASGGVQPYVYSIIGTLPAGLSLNSATGHLTGTPTVAGTYSGLRVQVADQASGSAITPPFTIAVAAAPVALSVSGSPPATATVGAAYSAQFAASGGSGSGYVYTMLGTLPAGLTLNPSTGAITGSPTTAGSYSNLKVQVADSASATAFSATFSIIVSAAASALSISGSAPATATVGTAYSGQYTAIGGSGSGYAYSMIGTLPAGLTLNPSTGAITGSPTTAGTVSGLAVKVTDSASASATSNAFSITVSPPLSVVGYPPSGIVGANYSTTFAASGGSGTGYVYALTGTLPPGLTFNTSTGVLAGVPTTAGTYAGLQAGVTDSLGGNAVGTVFSIIVTAAGAQLAISGSPSGAASIGQPYSAQFTASGGTGSYTYSLTGTLPTGLALNPATGAIVGTPSGTANSYYPNLKVSVTDGVSTVTSPTFSITLVTGGILTVANGAAPLVAVVNIPYSFTPTFSGGTGSYPNGVTYTPLVATNGMSFHYPAQGGVINYDPSNGRIYGTTSFTGSQTFTYHVFDSASTSLTSAAVTFKVNPAISASVGLTPAGAVGYPYNSVVAGVVNGFENYQLSGIGYTTQSGPSLASLGLSVSMDPGTGSIRVSGTPTAAGTWKGTFSGMDAQTYIATSPVLTITIGSGLTLTPSRTTASVAQFQPLTGVTVTASGGLGNPANYLYSEVDVAGGTLASFGLTLDQYTGTISGSPINLGSWTGKVQVVDVASNITAQSPNITITVGNGVTAATGSAPPTAYVGEPYAANGVASAGGGTGTFSSVTANTVSGTPLATLGIAASLSGSQVNLSGSNGGKPVATGTWTGTFTITDSLGLTATTGQVTVTVAAGLSISGTPSNTTTGHAYSYPMTASGGSGGNTFTASNTSGTLAALGLALNPSTGAISGSTPVAGSWTGTITVTDTGGGSATTPALSITVTQNVVTGAYAWGNNSNGQLGNNSTTSASTQVGVSTSKTYIKVAGGSSFSCGIVNDGTVECWGDNSSGQLGTASPSQSLIPRVIPGLTGVTDIATGQDHACAVSSGTARCWGANGHGQLGVATSTGGPQLVTGLTTGVTAIAAGQYSSCAIVNGGAKCWGSNVNGQIGNTSVAAGTGTVSNATQVTGLTSGVTAISAGTGYACAVVNGGAQCWGSNQSANLGTGDFVQRTTPTQVPGLTSGVTAISAGSNYHTCAIVNGGAMCWGAGSSGQIGNGATTNPVYSPTQVSGLTSGVTSIATGSFLTCAVVNGGAKCWGYDGNGQLGNGTTGTNSSLPVDVTGLTSGVTQIATFGTHVLAR